MSRVSWESLYLFLGLYYLDEKKNLFDLGEVGLNKTKNWDENFLR